MTDPQEKLVIFVPKPKDDVSTLAKADLPPMNPSDRINSSDPRNALQTITPAAAERFLALSRMHHPSARFVEHQVAPGTLTSIKDPRMLGIVTELLRQAGKLPAGMLVKADSNLKSPEWQAMLAHLKEINAKNQGVREFHDTHEDRDAAHQYAENHAHQWGHGLSSHEKDGLKLYKSAAYTHINNHLRGITDYHHDHSPEVVQKAHDSIPHIDSALHKSRLNFPSGVTLHRGISGAHAELLHHQIQNGELHEGSPHVEMGYTSTSLFAHHAQDFMDGERATKGSKYTVHLKIHAPKGTIGAHLDHTTDGHTVNHEVLLPRQRLYTVNKIEAHPHPNGGTHYVIHQTITNHDTPPLAHH